ncbi:MAG: hypothetical protein ACK47B_01355 [Armatimonadota bacterium]
MIPTVTVSIQIQYSGVPLDDVSKVISDLNARWGDAQAPISLATHASAPAREAGPELEAVIRDATTNVRAFLRMLAEHAPEVLTAADLAQMLNHPEPRSIAGLRSVMKRSQNRLIRNGELSTHVKVFEEFWDGARMSYSMSEGQAAAVLAVLEKLGS